MLFKDTAHAAMFDWKTNGFKVLGVALEVFSARI